MGKLIDIAVALECLKHGHKWLPWAAAAYPDKPTWQQVSTCERCGIMRRKPLDPTEKDNDSNENSG